MKQTSNMFFKRGFEKWMQICIIIMSMKQMTHALNFASSADLKMLLKTEDRVIKSLQEYVKAEKKRLDFLEKYLARSKTEYEIAMKDIPYYFGNPINAFTIIKRLGPDLEFAEHILKNKTELKTPDAVFPTDEDMKNTVRSLVTLRYMYNISITDLANGVLKTTAGPSEVYTDIVAPMTASDCYSIGKILFLNKQYLDGLSWMEEVYKKLEGVKCDICPVSVVDVIDHICRAYHELGDTGNFIKWAEKRIYLKPDDDESQEYARFINHVRHREVFKKPTEGRKCKGGGCQTPSVEKNSADNITLLCLGRTKNNTNNRKSMSCNYAHGPHPFLTLAPLKAELLHHDPDLMLFHEVLNRNEIDTLLRLATPRLWNSTSKGLQDYHNAEHVKLADEASDVVARVSRRALHLSGLSPEDSENLKVISYGIGGFYREHWDSKPADPHSGKRPRVASIVFYLSDVEQGGATTFPLLDLAVFPKKSTALFWMNLLPSGTIDPWLMHIGCPVLRGAKWLAIKWPHQFPKKEWCPLWRNERGIVTEEIYEEILKDREVKFRKHIGR